MSGEYRVMKGIEARKRLNELGYAVSGQEDIVEGLVYMVVALAERIDNLEMQVATLSERLQETGH